MLQRKDEGWHAFCCVLWQELYPIYHIQSLLTACELSIIPALPERKLACSG